MRFIRYCVEFIFVDYSFEVQCLEYELFDTIDMFKNECVSYHVTIEKDF